TIPGNRGLYLPVGVPLDNHDFSVRVLSDQGVKCRTVRRLRIDKHEPIEFRPDIDCNLCRPPTLLYPLRHGRFDEVTFARFDPDGARSCTGKRVDVPKLGEMLA